MKQKYFLEFCFFSNFFKSWKISKKKLYKSDITWKKARWLANAEGLMESSCQVYCRCWGLCLILKRWCPRVPGCQPAFPGPTQTLGSLLCLARPQGSQSAPTAALAPAPLCARKQDTNHIHWQHKVLPFNVALLDPFYNELVNTVRKLSTCFSFFFSSYNPILVDISTHLQTSLYEVQHSQTTNVSIINHMQIGH